MTSKSASEHFRRNVLIEALIVGGAACLAIFWIIPTQTAAVDTAAGLAPAALPTVCAVAIAALVLISLVINLVRGKPVAGAEPQSEQATDPQRTSLSAALKVMLVSLAGVVALNYGGPAVCSAVVVPLGMLVLGERRPGLIALVTLGTAAPFLLLFR